VASSRPNRSRRDSRTTLSPTERVADTREPAGDARSPLAGICMPPVPVDVGTHDGYSTGPARNARGCVCARGTTDEEGQKATPVRVSPKTLHASDRLTALHGQPLSALLLCGWPLHKPVYEKLPVDRRDSRGRDHGSIAWMTGPVSSPPAAAPIHPAAACSPATAPP
jgi:hypothetical protein